VSSPRDVTYVCVRQVRHQFGDAVPWSVTDVVIPPIAGGVRRFRRGPVGFLTAEGHIAGGVGTRFVQGVVVEVGQVEDFQGGRFGVTGVVGFDSFTFGGKVDRPFVGVGVGAVFRLEGDRTDSVGRQVFPVVDYVQDSVLECWQCLIYICRAWFCKNLQKYYFEANTF
jgi:hypothetical protein